MTIEITREWREAQERRIAFERAERKRLMIKRAIYATALLAIVGLLALIVTPALLELAGSFVEVKE